jgi:CBS-domain-containing membrane protein
MNKPLEALKAEAHMAEAKAIERLLRESTTCETWMTPQPYTVAPTDSLDRARKLLKLHRINQLPVVDHGNQLLGIVTDRDLHKRQGRTSADVRVESVMSHPAIAVARHSTLINAAEVMRLSRIGSVPITDGKCLVGIVTRSDILGAFVAFAQGHYRRAERSDQKREHNESADGVVKRATRDVEPQTMRRSMSKSEMRRQQAAHHGAIPKTT